MRSQSAPGLRSSQLVADASAVNPYQSLELIATAGLYGSVLGVRFEPGRGPDGWNVSGVAPMSGLSGGAQRAAVIPMLRLDEIQAAVERVRAAGGSASEPMREGYGIRAECADDQGVKFHLGNCQCADQHHSHPSAYGCPRTSQGWLLGSRHLAQRRAYAGQRLELAGYASAVRLQ
jgi:predicted enzyme related to lactoylglutathione lyase